MTRSSGQWRLDAKLDTIETVMSELDIFVSSTGNLNAIASDHKKLKNNAFVGNNSTLVNEIGMLSEGLEGTQAECVFP